MCKSVNRCALSFSNREKSGCRNALNSSFCLGSVAISARELQKSTRRAPKIAPGASKWGPGTSRTPPQRTPEALPSTLNVPNGALRSPGRARERSRGRPALRFGSSGGLPDPSKTCVFLKENNEFPLQRPTVARAESSPVPTDWLTTSRRLLHHALRINRVSCVSCPLAGGVYTCFYYCVD